MELRLRNRTNAGMRFSQVDLKLLLEDSGSSFLDQQLVMPSSTHPPYGADRQA